MENITYHKTTIGTIEQLGAIQTTLSERKKMVLYGFALGLHAGNLPLRAFSAKDVNKDISFFPESDTTQSQPITT